MYKKSIILTSLILSACGFIEPDFKDYMKCGYVANQLQQQEALSEIARKMESYAKENKIAADNMLLQQLSEEIQNDLELYRLNRNGKFQRLLEVYNSSTCQNMHSQGKVSIDMYY